MNDYTNVSNDTAHIHPSALPRVYGSEFQAKHQQLGGEAGFLGQPTTEIQICPDGQGIYQHFQGGSLYWHNGQIHEIHGAIRDRWAELGWERSWLGYPVSDEYVTRDNGRQTDFQNGSIYWRSDAGAIEYGDCRLWFTGLICFGEQSGFNEHGDSDEPYLIVTSYDANESVATQKFPPDRPAYNEVNSGDVIEFRGVCYHGRPSMLNLHCVLMEHDQGDPNAYRDRIDQFVRKAITAGEATAAAFGTPISIPPEAGDLLTEIINALAMTGDDLIAEGHKSFNGQQISQMIADPPQEEKGIPHHFSVYLTDGDASYKAYFLLER